jgi:hypothetical protein
MENERFKKELEIKQHEAEIQRQYQEMEIKKQNMDQINEINNKMIDLQSGEMIEEAQVFAAMKTVRKNEDYLNETHKLILNGYHHDNEFIKNANNLINGLQAERNEILEENRRSEEIINEATIRNTEKLNILEQSLDAAYQRISDSEANIQMLQMGEKI